MPTECPHVSDMPLTRGRVAECFHPIFFRHSDSFPRAHRAFDYPASHRRASVDHIARPSAGRAVISYKGQHSLIYIRHLTTAVLEFMTEWRV
jgi:hypothetical protein